MPASEPAQTGFAWSAADAPERYVEAWHHIVHLGDALDDARLIAEFGYLSGITSDHIPVAESGRVEAYAIARVAKSNEELSVRVQEPTLEHISARFADEQSRLHPLSTQTPAIEIVTIKVRRYKR